MAARIGITIKKHVNGRTTRNEILSNLIGFKRRVRIRSKDKNGLNINLSQTEECK